MDPLDVSADAMLDNPVELLFLGTGTSSCVPHVDCLTAPPGGKQCRTCLSTLTPEGKKNIRRNTSIAMRVRGIDGNKFTIIVDVGKSFQAAAVEWFPKYGLRRIDAVLITHAHADAMNGLDDLRAWTLHSAIQPYVDLYVSQATFVEVQRSFPYLVAKEFASGGGDVPEFKWHIIDDRRSFEIENTGIRISPFAVHHGRIFSTVPPPQFIPTPNSNTPSSTSPPTPDIIDSPGRSAITLSLERPLSPELPKPIQPYLCLGFVINDCITYISDVSHIPEDVWDFLQPQNDGHEGANVPPVFILDCLRPKSHTSHLGIAESVAYARRMGAQRTYLTGFGHEVSHDEYQRVCESVGGKVIPLGERTQSEEKCLSLIQEGKSLWLRPAFDGLRVFVNGDGEATDETYN
ncbi:hypothetical protein EUX98_g4464 [Antrodiella citrinella]|uniref:Metallo-beta-lactamase domain-containing protein n=1 Tax=Antrodiella citrinella TaxID=2447956 RepID=A0A4S4MWP7_9APHY|nr:hypothetical protein EUX98_g4464 [Antrodiella citrinella]